MESNDQSNSALESSVPGLVPILIGSAILVAAIGARMNEEYSMKVFAKAEQLTLSARTRLYEFAKSNRLELQIGEESLEFTSNAQFEDDLILREVSLALGEVSPIKEQEGDLKWNGTVWIVHWESDERLPWSAWTTNTVKVIALPDEKGDVTVEAKKCFSRVWSNPSAIIGKARADVLGRLFSDTPEVEMWPDEIAIDTLGNYTVYFVSTEYTGLKICYAADGQVLY